MRRKLTREEMMNKLRTDSIHSERGNGARSRASATADDDDSQLTVKRRNVEEKPSLTEIFEKNPL
ncbi:hypothetical protein Tcan_07243 [Toxocara canis]|uniref:Uncharacterized protein n=1 Tax=Toxocara canis TaxID=6265 RepID=A0A0B2UUC4_TOXCA|nr:hypothetical protein Tcan_07243 [Toxocara canis]